VYNASGATRWDSRYMLKKVTELPPTPPPTAALTINGSTGPVTVNVGDSLSYRWSSTNAVSAKATYVTDTPACGQTTTGPLDLVPGTIPTAGTLNNVVLVSCQAGRTYTIILTTTSADGRTAVARVTIVVKAAPVVSIPTGTLSVTPCTVGLNKSTTDPNNSSICDQTVSWNTTNATDVKMVVAGASPYTTSSFPNGYTAGTGANGSGTFWVTTGTYTATLYSGTTVLDTENFTIVLPATAEKQRLNQMASVLQAIQQIVSGWIR